MNITMLAPYIAEQFRTEFERQSRRRQHLYAAHNQRSARRHRGVT